jgi:hypothetical protein
MINVNHLLDNNPFVYYYIIEKEFRNVRLLSEKLNSGKFICLGVSHNIDDFSKIFSKMLNKPFLLFIGFHNVTKGELDQIDFFSRAQSLKIILFSDNISEYNNSYGLNYSVIKV